MKQITSYFILVFFAIFISCEKDGIDDQAQPVDLAKLSGYVQKGPFNNGTNITVFELTENLAQTGRAFHTEIIDNKGTFEINNIELSSQYVELKANGFYFNEILGENSSAQLTLSALADLSKSESVNINVLSELEKSRVEYLINDGLSFDEAKKQVQEEILKIFSIHRSDINSSEFLDITKPGDDNAILLAVSLILQGHRTTSDLSELLANISTEIREDGTLKSASLGSALINHAKHMNFEKIRENLESRYNDLGQTINIPDFEKYVELFVDSTDFEFTNYIKYPETSGYGINILNENNSVFAPNLLKFSMAANIPQGSSLKIVLKHISGNAPVFDNNFWAYAVMPDGPINWKVSTYDSDNCTQEFEIIEAEKDSDLKIVFHGGNDIEIDIEYYENTEDIPTKTRRIYIDDMDPFDFSDSTDFYKNHAIP